ncbi:MAG TPA: SCO family protein [Bryobacteraceae bacterium]|nr:SCO family protein [Bryobacteraceae bacterium]
MRRRYLPGVVAWLLALVGCNSGSTLASYGVVPDFLLTDQSGQSFDSKQRLNGKVWVANLIFTTCNGPCPRMSAQFRKLQNELGSKPDFRLVSITIDPARDTPTALAAYGRNFGATGETWSLLTGSAADLQKLSLDTFHLARIDGNLEHGTRFVLVDKQSRIRGYYDSADPEEMRKLTADVNTLLQGA